MWYTGSSSSAEKIKEGLINAMDETVAVFFIKSLLFVVSIKYIGYHRKFKILWGMAGFKYSEQ
jgi:hypothetical protein